MKKTVILDTDFIINIVKNKIELSIKEKFPFPVEISILDKTLEELKNKPYEKLALHLIKDFKIIKTKKDDTVDNLILALIEKGKSLIIATQDKKLKEKLKKGKVPIITIRQQKYLFIEGF